MLPAQPNGCFGKNREGPGGLCSLQVLVASPSPGDLLLKQCSLILSTRFGFVASTSSSVRLSGILFPLPRPHNEREAWERGLWEELPTQLAGYLQEFAAGPADKTRREWLE